ncbi:MULTISPECIES: DUF4738 domain-containing protein [Flavobacterium]|uniref:DUF4738 domain-containing protein n=1 Tax=Flavobacterium TaxID=237 RepID=UPI00188A989E|nr:MULTISPECIES: DUF4738 domain-containing protein [Flavobacterium]MBF4472724.1 DUF4738 domain-containing protein [Flavobacterium sp. HJJ]
MRKNILILILAFLLFACNSQTEKKKPIIKTADNSVVILINKKSEKFIPETKGTEKFDTIIADSKIQITIKKTDLDSYVINEYEEDGNKQIDKYRDAEISLTIKQNSQIFLDTVFTKKQFSKYVNKGFLDNAIFLNYWFEASGKDKIQFFGVIAKPETDNTIDFYHYFDLANRKLTFVQKTEEDED